MRNILAATGQSGGISAEQILRQFNAKRFTEASKAWSAAEGNIAGSDPLDPLFFVPPTTPVYPSSSSTSQQPQPQPQEQEHQQEHQQQHRQEPFVPHGAAPATECAGGASGSAFCTVDGTGSGGGGGGGTSSADVDMSRVRELYARFGGGGSKQRQPQQQQYRRCGGGWVC